MKKNNYSVYKHIFPNGKIYIGITGQKPENRWSEGKGYKSQSLIYNAIQKYGWNNIKHIIILNNLSHEEAKCLEITLIALYQSNNIKYGYNMTKGGDGVSGWKMSEEQKEKDRIAHIGLYIGQHHSPNTEIKKGQHLSKETEFKKGNQSPAKGKKRSKETREKLSIIMKGKTAWNKGKKLTKEQKKNKFKSVICVETNKIYESIIEAETDTGVFNIGYACSGKRKTAGGYHWKWYYVNEKDK